MKKRLVAILTAVVALLAFAAFAVIAVARAEKCDVCDGTYILVSSVETIEESKKIICDVNPLYQDLYVKYRVTNTWACNGDCGGSYSTHRFRTSISCGHDKNSGY